MDLGSVMVEYDGVEIAAVVVLNEILCGVGDLQAPGPEALLLKQRLIQGKNHLQETSSGNELVLHKRERGKESNKKKKVEY